MNINLILVQPILIILRSVSKKDLIHNDATPLIEVNPETYEVKVEGEHITCEPLAELPLTQRYFLF